MKNIKLAVILFILVIIGGSKINAYGSNTEPSYKINLPISIPELKLSKNTYISDYKYVDITGDNIKDNVILVGTKQNKKDIYFYKLSIIVQDGKTKKYIKTSLGENSEGYEPQMCIGDFNGDKVSDALISMPTGGSGGMVNYSLFTLKNNLPDVMSIEPKIDLKGEFENDFKAKLSSKALNKTFDIDLSPNKEEYIKMGVYDEKGNLKRKVEPYLVGLSALKPTDNDKKGTYELVGYQRIVGVVNADTLGYMTYTLKWNDTSKSFDISNVVFEHVFDEDQGDICLYSNEIYEKVRYLL